MARKQHVCEVAFVLGGRLRALADGSIELSALAESSIEPDLILGTSVGAVNGALFAADPTPEGVVRLSKAWRESSALVSSAGALWT